MKRKSKKILSLWILCLVAIMCVSVGILSACNEHVHHYEWKYEEGGTEHWKECPDDGVEEEGSRGDHIFVAGECECGATQTVAEKKYGKAHGQVKLRGIGGKYEYDFSDVTVDMGDEVDPDFDTETGELNIENIEAGKIHTLTISKPDYQPYVVSVLVEEDDDVEIGGSRGMVLQRGSFDTTVNWGNYNLSKANDETGEISVTNRHFMVLTKDNYDEVAFTLNLNGFKRPGGGIKQGLPLVGDDGNTIEQGIAIAFGKDLLSVRMVGKNKVALWNTWLAGEWKGGNALTGSQEKELYVFKDGEQYLKDFEANNLALTVYRKENRVSVFLNGTFIGDGTLDDKYKDIPCSVGIIAHNAVDDISWKHWNFTVDSGNKAVTLTNNTATDAHGAITGIPESVNFGDRVTLTVTPETDYKLSALLINGVNVIKDLHGNSYSFVITKDTTVEAQFAKIVYSSVNATVSGKSFGKTTALPQGTDVTLTSNGFDDITTQLAADGLKIDRISAGVWTVNIEGYLPVEITVDDGEAYAAAIILERDPFNTTVQWGEFNFENANDVKGKFGISNDCFLILSNEMYDAVAVTMYLNGSQSETGSAQQGIAIAFGGTDVLTVRMVGKEKLALWNTWIATHDNWGQGANALTGSQENGELYVFDADGQYLKDFEKGELRLTVYRTGNEIIVYLNDTMVGRGTVDAKYADASCSIGFVGHEMASSWKYWDFTVETENLPEISKFSVTNETDPSAHGSVTGFPEGNVDFGYSVTLTVKPENGYMIEKLLINGNNVISQLVDNQYTFAVKGDVTVAAVFKEIIPASIQAAVKGKAFGKTSVLPAETNVTLTSKSGLDPVTAKLTANGLEIADIASGMWTVKIEGYLPFEITVEDETEYNNEIVLERDAFDTTVNWGKFDFTQVNNAPGKVGVTDGNCLLLTKDTFDEVSLTMYLGKETCKDNTQQGIAIAFGKQVITVRMVGKEKLAIGNTWIADEWKGGSIDGSTENGNLFTFADGSQYLKDFGNNNLRLTVARKGNRIFIYLNDDFIGSSSFAENYNNAKCSIGFVGHDLADGNKFWKFELKTELLRASVTDKTAVGAHGKVEGIPESVNFGETVTITVTPDANYKISALLINGKDVLNELENNAYSFVVASAVTVEARFVQIVNGSLNAAISGKMFGKAVAFDKGTAVTLSAVGISSISATVGDNGDLKIASIPVGEWTVTIEGYLPFAISITEATEYDTAIVLERDAFNTTVNWNDYNFEKANEALGEFGTNSDYFLVLSNETFDKVAFTVYLNGKPTDEVKGEQGIALAFGKQVITVRMVGKEKLAIWNTWLAGEWKGGAIDGNTENSDLYSFSSESGAKYLTAFDKGELRLTVLRKGHQIFIYLNDNFIGSSSFAERYDTEKCSVGFVGHEMEKSWKSWKFKVEDDIPEFTVTNNTASDANGSLTIAGVTGGKAEFGETVTLTLSPSDGYKISKLTVGGEDVTDRLNGSAYSFVIGKDTEVKAEFAQIIPGSVNAAIKGLSFGKTTDLAGKQVTLSSSGLENVTTTVTEDGMVLIASIPAGVWTIGVEGYLPKNITVLENTAYNTEIVMERDAFNTTVNWNDYNFEKANEALGEFGTNSDNFLVLSNETYNAVAVTMYLNGSQSKIGSAQQGIALAFGKQVITVRMVGKEKLAIWNTWLAGEWKGGSIDGSTENADLYSFSSESGAKYLTAFDSGTLRLTVLRKGHRIFIYLNDNFIGSSSFAEKYDTEKCSVGFVGHDMEKSWKSWKFMVEDDIPEFTVTNNTASDANGSLTIAGVTGGKAEFGETVTLTLSPSDGYKISKLTVGGEDVTDRLNGSSYSFVIGKDTEVKAEFAQIIPGSVNAAIKGLSFGKTTDLAGKQVTLSSNGLENVTTTVTEDGMVLIASIPAGIWTVSVEGYLTKDITVLENTAYTTEIVLERDAFNTTVNWGKFNFDKANAETGEFSVANDCFLILSNETYDNVGVTMYLNGNQTWKDDIEQGIAIAFGKQVITVRMVGKEKLAIWNTWITGYWDGSGSIDGSTENADLYSFSSESGAKYLTAFESGELRLTVFRNGHQIFIYLNDNYIGSSSFAERYDTEKCSVGFVGHNMEKSETEPNKTWKFKVIDADVTVEDATAQNAGGTVSITSNVKVGDTVTITVAPDETHMFGSLTVSGGVTPELQSDGVYTFVAYNTQYTVTATFTEKPATEVAASVVGEMYDGTKITEDSI